VYDGARCTGSANVAPVVDRVPMSHTSCLLDSTFTEWSKTVRAHGSVPRPNDGYRLS